MLHISISPIDITIVLVYIVGIAVWELMHSKKKTKGKGPEGYFLAGLYRSGHKGMADKMKEALFLATALPGNHFGFYEYIEAFC